MAQQSIAGLAVLIVLGFAIAALSACASSEQTAIHHEGPINIAYVDETPATPEFHDAVIGDDVLRSRIEAY